MGIVKHEHHNEIAVLIGHCQMYLYGAQGSSELILNEVAKQFYSFAMLHLVSTMFLIKDNRNDTQVGVFHRILDKIGLESLLVEIDSIMILPVGHNTLKEYLRQKRNRLATHGTLLIESEKENISEVSFNEEYVHQYINAMNQLDYAIGNLLAKLEEIICIGVDNYKKKKTKHFE